MRLSTQTIDDILFYDKPYGYHLESEPLNCTGAIAQLPSGPGTEDLIRKDFVDAFVTAHFLTDRWSEKDEFSHKNLAYFTRIKSSPFFSLWQVRVEHALRHHIPSLASEVGLPVLGDPAHKGSPYPFLCLHFESIEVRNKKVFSAAPPRIFERLGFLKDLELVNLLMGLDRRQRIFKFLQNPGESLRLCHLESSRFRIDQFGEQLWVYDFSLGPLTAQDQNRFRYLSQTIGKPLLVRKMKNRGEAKANLKDGDDFICGPWKPIWEASENGVKYEFRDFQGLSPGLFLDQRENRKWVFQNSKGKKVLNLFAFTGGFSINAALAKAQQVTTVDLSQNFLDWTKKNFELNSLDPAQHEFYKKDSRDFLEVAFKKNRKWDVIIIDPPSFSRSDRGVFKIEKDLRDLVSMASQTLEKKGKILISTNYEKWDQKEFEKTVQNSLPLSKKIAFSWQGDDFESPSEIEKNLQLLKSGVWSLEK